MEKTRHHFVAIIDVNSSSVGACVIKKFNQHKNNKEKKSEIIWHSRKYINFNDDLNFKIYFKNIETALIEIVNLIKKEQYKPQNIYCFLSTPFFVSRSKTSQHQLNPNSAIKNDFIEKIISNNVNKFLSETPQLYSDILDDEKVIIENQIQSIKLNGYVTQDPAGKKAKTLEISHYMSLGSKNILNRLNSSLSQINHKAHIEFISSLYGYASIFSTLYPSKDSAILLDVSGELTDIIVISNSTINSHVSFPIGNNSVIRKAQNLLNSTKASAQSELVLFAEGELAETAKNKLKENLEPIKKEWTEKFESALELVMENSILPESVYIISDGSISKIFTGWLEPEDYSKYTLSNKNLSFNLINRELFRSKVDFSKNSSADPFLLYKSVYTEV